MHATLKPFAVDRNRNLLRRISNKLPIIEAGESAYFRVHQKALEVQSKIGIEHFSKMTTIACVRNPFDHAVSHYEYLKIAPSGYLRDLVGKMSFEQYLATRLAPGRRGRDRFLRLPQLSDYIADADGNIIVKTVLRFENLQTEFDTLLDHLGIERQKLSHKRKRHKPRPSLKPYFDTTTTELVRRIYAEDFTNFGYDRDVPA